jgi:hypothetical protein
MEHRFAFCKVTWLPKYRGEPHVETRFRNIQDGEGGEAYLFKPLKGACFGYVHLGRTDPEDDDTIRSINLRQFDKHNRSKSINGIHIIWIAARLDGPGVCVVGEYQNATVYARQEPELPTRPFGWNISAKKSDVRFIPEPDRKTLEDVPLRQGNLWYAKGAKDQVVRKQALTDLKRLATEI